MHSEQVLASDRKPEHVLQTIITSWNKRQGLKSSFVNCHHGHTCSILLVNSILIMKMQKGNTQLIFPFILGSGSLLQVYSHTADFLCTQKQDVLPFFFQCEGVGVLFLFYFIFLNCVLLNNKAAKVTSISHASRARKKN